MILRSPYTPYSIYLRGTLDQGTPNLGKPPNAFPLLSSDLPRCRQYRPDMSFPFSVLAYIFSQGRTTDVPKGFRGDLGSEGLGFRVYKVQRVGFRVWIWRLGECRYLRKKEQICKQQNKQINKNKCKLQGLPAANPFPGTFWGPYRMNFRHVTCKWALQLLRPSPQRLNVLCSGFGVSITKTQNGVSSHSQTVKMQGK